MSLDGRTALVTGGGRGIGRAIAHRLAKASARVVLLGRTEAEITKVARETGGVAIVADLADRKSADAAIESIARGERSIDVLVNNAGIAESAPLDRSSDAMWDRQMEINATSAFRLCRAFVPAMVNRGWGRVINVASNAGLTGYPYTAAYCASKAAMIGMTRALAVDLAKTGVTMNAVCPGWVETRMAGEAIDRIVRKTGRSEAEARAALEKMSPQGRMIDPDEVALVVAMLCEERARGIHGQAIVIDGGQVMK